MAVDSAAKRYSMMGLGSPVPSMLPIPDGTIGAADQAVLVYLYYGVALGTALTVTSRDNAYFIKFRDKRNLIDFRDKRIFG